MEVTMDDKKETEDALMAPEPRIEKSVYYMLQQSKALMEEILGKMLSIKKEAQPKSQPHELVTQMFLHFVVLRQANRSILLEAHRVKAESNRNIRETK